jgi:hypothetical protein
LFASRERASVLLDALFEDGKSVYALVLFFRDSAFAQVAAEPEVVVNGPEINELMPMQRETEQKLAEK